MELKVGTFNLYQYAKPPIYWYEIDDRNTYTVAEWNDKESWLKDQIKEMNCDIIGFQEIFSIKELETLVKELGYSHLRTVDTPVSLNEDNTVFKNPVVAIASKHLIKDVKALKVQETTKTTLNLPIDFDFSRKPIKAKVEIDNIGEIIVYVSHLKSKRPMIDSPNFSDSDTWEFKIREELKARSLGHVASLRQRGAEASELYLDISNTLEQNNDTPIIVLGDLNDDEKSIPIEAILNSDRLYEVGKDKEDIADSAYKYIYKYKLYDTFNLAPNQNGEERTPTHYHRGKGGTLDYIFVSNSFNEKNYFHKGRVTSFKVLDKHLQSDGVGDKKQSDHAQVVVTIKLINSIDTADQ